MFSSSRLFQSIGSAYRSSFGRMLLVFAIFHPGLRTQKGPKMIRCIMDTRYSRVHDASSALDPRCRAILELQCSCGSLPVLLFLQFSLPRWLEHHRDRSASGVL